MEAKPIAGALGAEITGVDLSHLEKETISFIRKAFLEHLVIFFRDQRLTPPQQLAFAQCLGEPMAYPQLKGLPDCPMITPVVKLEHETVNFGGVWHSDTTYLDTPPMAGAAGVSVSSMEGSLELTCKAGKLRIKAEQNIKLSATATIDVNAGQDLTLEGNTEAKLTSSAASSYDAPKVNIA